MRDTTLQIRLTSDETAASIVIQDAARRLTTRYILTRTKVKDSRVVLSDSEVLKVIAVDDHIEAAAFIISDYINSI